MLHQILAAWICVWVLVCSSIAGATEKSTKLNQGQINLVGAVLAIEEETYSPNYPERRIVLTRSFDENGNITESTVSLIDKAAPSKSSKRRTVIIRDEAGEIIEDKIYGNGEVLAGNQRYRYNQHEQLAEKVTYESDGSESTKWLYRYDDRGNEKEMAYYITGVLKARYVYEHDEQGNKVKTAAFKSDGSLEYRTVAKFDEQNRMVESVSYTTSGDIDRRQTYKYNGAGYLVEQVVQNREGLIIDKQVYSYEFDKKGNWIRRVTAKSTSPSEKAEQIEIANRRITYRTGKENRREETKDRLDYQ